MNFLKLPVKLKNKKTKNKKQKINKTPKNSHSFGYFFMSY